MTGERRDRAAARRRGTRLVTTSLCIALAAVVGCTHHHTKKEEINEREYAPYRERGSARISGSVTMTTSGGTVLVGSACQVRLTPVTDDSTRYIQDVVMKGDTKPWKEDADAVWWVTAADEQGRFTFEDVPAGSYYLTCPVAWRDSVDGSARQRILWAQTTVAGSESVDVTVSR
jgi:hypothetical protein